MTLMRTFTPKRRDLLRYTGIGIITAVGGSNVTAAQESNREQESLSTGDNYRFYEDFEHGNLDDWELVWRDANTQPSNDWSVERERSTAGDHSLYIDANGDSNLIATKDRVIDVSGDFELSYSFYLGDSDHRTCGLYMYDLSENGSESEPINNVNENREVLLNARRRDSTNEASFHGLGNEQRYQDIDKITPQEHNDILLKREGDDVYVYYNGELVLEGDVDASDLPLDREYRLLVAASGAWGRPTEIWFDDINFKRTDVPIEDEDEEEEEDEEKEEDKEEEDDEEKEEEEEKEEDKEEEDDEDDVSDTATLTASFSYGPSSPEVNQQVAFNAGDSSGSGSEIVNYRWEFGDGETGTGETTTHQYTESGGYNVTLTVVDSEDQTDTVTETVSIDTEGTSDNESTVEVPGFGIGTALTAFGTAGYLLKRKLGSDSNM